MAYRMCYPCLACRKENSAPRPKCRCSKCSKADQAARMKRYRDRLARGTVMRDPRSPIRRRPQSLTWAATAPDDDIARYRAEKAARTQLGPADQFAEARLHLLALDQSQHPKRGRPRKTQDKAA